MAFPASYVNAYTLGEGAKGLVNYNTDTFEVELYVTAFDGLSIDKISAESLTAAPWNANKVDYTGATASNPGGGDRCALVNPAIDTISSPSDAMRFTDGGSATAIWTNGTFTADGCGVFDTTHASDLLAAALDFGGGKEVVTGTLTITWSPTQGIIVVTV